MNIEKLAIEHGFEKLGTNTKGEITWLPTTKQLEAFAKALQSSEPVADYTPNKDCTMCNGGGMYCVGYSGCESDGNAPILERCECYLDNITPPASVTLEKYNKLLERLRVSNKHIKDWWNNFGEGGSKLPPAHSARLVDENEQAIAEAEGKEE